MGVEFYFLFDDLYIMRGAGRSYKIHRKINKTQRLLVAKSSRAIGVKFCFCFDDFYIMRGAGSEARGPGRGRGARGAGRMKCIGKAIKVNAYWSRPVPDQ